MTDEQKQKISKLYDEIKDDPEAIDFLSNKLEDNANYLSNAVNTVTNHLAKNRSLRDYMWDYLLRLEKTILENITIKNYFYKNNDILRDVLIINRLNRYIQQACKNFSTLLNNNASNLILMSQLQYRFPNLIISTDEFGIDFATIQLNQMGTHCVELTSTGDEQLIPINKIKTIGNLLNNMDSHPKNKDILKLDYHNIEAKNSTIAISKFNFSDLMTIGCYFDRNINHHKLNTHELRYMSSSTKTISYDGFIRSFHLLDSEQYNVVFMFVDRQSGQKLQNIVDCMKVLFKNINVYLYTNEMEDLSTFYMKLELWMLYQDINWHVKIFNKWDYLNDGSILGSLLEWSIMSTTLTTTEFYMFIKKRLVYIFTKYIEIRNVVKEVLLEDLKNIKTSAKNKTLTQDEIEQIMRQENILYKFENAQSVRITGGVSASYQLTDRELEPFLNKIIGSDEEFIENLKKLGKLITNDDPNVVLTNQDYLDIFNNTSDLNDNFSAFKVPWRTKRQN